VTRRSTGVRAAYARAARALLAAGLGAATALLLVSCSGSGGLIPAGNAGPLQGDFQAIASAAERGNGKCADTEAAISKTELDFSGLPSSVDAGLRSTLRQGIDNLKRRALGLCTQPLPAATNTTATSTQTTTTTPATTQTTTTNTSTTPPTTTTNASPGGGTPAEEPKESKTPEPGGEEPKASGGGQEAGK
jgi:hypothetical protein